MIFSFLYEINERFIFIIKLEAQADWGWVEQISSFNSGGQARAEPQPGINAPLPGIVQPKRQSWQARNRNNMGAHSELIWCAILSRRPGLAGYISPDGRRRFVLRLHRMPANGTIDDVFQINRMRLALTSEVVYDDDG
jgi:hypothetical protein